MVAVNPRRDHAEARSQADGFEIVRVPDLTSSMERELEATVAQAPSVAKLMETVMPLLTRHFSIRERVQHRLQRKFLKGVTAASARTGLRLKIGRRIAARTEVKPIVEAWRLRWLILGGLTLTFEGRKHNPDIVWSNDSNTLLPGLALRDTAGAKFVFDAHEAFTEQLPPGQESESTLKLYRLLESSILPYTDARCTVCDAVGSFYSERYSAKPFTTIRNVPSRRFLVEPDLLKRRNSPRIAIYQGAYFRYRGLEPLIEATKYMRDTVLHLRGVGEYEQDLRRLAEDVKADDRLRFLPAVKVDDLVEGASHADIGLNMFPSLCLNTSFALPNKFFEYLMGGLATASSDLVELRAHTERYGTGVLVPSLEPEVIAEHLDALSRDGDRLDGYRETAWKHARDELNWETEQARLFSLIEAL